MPAESDTDCYPYQSTQKQTNLIPPQSSLFPLVSPGWSLKQRTQSANQPQTIRVEHPILSPKHPFWYCNSFCFRPELQVYRPKMQKIDPKCRLIDPKCKRSTQNAGLSTQNAICTSSTMIYLYFLRIVRAEILQNTVFQR